MPITRYHLCVDISGGIRNAKMWRNCIMVYEIGRAHV